ncbi:SAC3 family protein A-like isoform X2 [Aristolochia californica]|uniref:SAC3 family protein A-like isoform X2 n=1 Tax=Aristolochia californica TaxID=171875 RepID=UPI0035E08217
MINGMDPLSYETVHLTHLHLLVWSQVESMSMQAVHLIQLLLTPMDMVLGGIKDSRTTLAIKIKQLTIHILSKLGHIKLQTTGGGYQNSGYSGQTNFWHDASYGNYNHHYPHYAPSNSNGTQYHGSSSVAASSVQYQQQYKQWADYYSQSSSDVSCAPGTENIPVTTTSTTTISLECPIPGVSRGYPVETSQPPPPGTTTWRLDDSSSELPSFQVTISNQVAATVSENHDNSWKNMSPGFSNSHLNNPPSYFHKPSESNPILDKSFEHQRGTTVYTPQFPSLQYPTASQVHPQTYQPQSSASTLDTRRTNNIQIPTNPRIASGLALGITKADKDTSATDTPSKPAYISVSIPKPNLKVSTSGSSADTVLKPEAFPASLRAYVERALGRCKDDSQKAACQNIMKEMITKASADGTLFTQNWDIEPLFPLPALDLAKDQAHSPILSSLSKYKKSPTRRTKSRWEPLPEDKLIEKLASVNYDPIKDVSWVHSKEKERVVDSRKSEGKDEIGSHMKFFFSSNASYQSKSTQRPVKKPRFGDDGDSSSGSDQEQGLASYYAASINLANSPEERKKRENRFKRFDKGQEVKAVRHRGNGAGNLYSRTTALIMSKRNEEGQSRAVEDMDWDALTVKGTCQEIEKRYLRLTSAPDPATVRPEEVLEKALVLVQSSNKNYLYRCDQLKSIRQDLTVQRIHNELTVKVYETHARLALEAGDLPEYNQCQSQLKTLYSDGIKGCYMEFTAYSLLCVILHSNNNRDLLSSMARLSVEAKGDGIVKHALAVRSAVTSGNYVLFFRLYKTAPYLSTCLMDLYVERMRFDAVRCMSRSYRPTVPVAFIAQVLGFLNVATAEVNDEKESDGVEECEEWLRAHGASIILDNNGEKQLDTKATSSSLFMPEPEDAVAHGDANLAVNDFLTRTS